jgi:hypothetical protein
MITAAEVQDLAFDRKIETAKITDSIIEAANFSYIRPILTENFYDYVVANVADYQALVDDYIKPCLAYYIKYLIMPDIVTEVSERGAFILESENATPSTNIKQLMTNTLSIANVLAEKLTDYVKKQHEVNADYELYGDLSDIDEEDSNWRLN